MDLPKLMMVQDLRKGYASEPTVSEVLDWLRERGTADYEAAAKAWINYDEFYDVWEEEPDDLKEQYVDIMTAAVDAALFATVLRSVEEGKT